MKLWRWVREYPILILDTGGSMPRPLERGLALCRSLTLDVDRILLGPVCPGDLPEFLCLNDQGGEIPAEEEDGAVFLRFLAASGYGEYASVRCGGRILSPSEAQLAPWHGRLLTDRELRILLSL